MHARLPLVAHARAGRRVKRRLWRTPICGAVCMSQASANPGMCCAIKAQQVDHPATRLHLDGGQVLHVDGAVAGQARPEKQRDVVAPGHVRSVELAQLLAAELHDAP